MSRFLCSSFPPVCPLIRRFGFFAMLAACRVGAETALPTFASTREVEEFFSVSCLECHRGKNAEGEFRMKAMLDLPTISGREDSWKNVLDRMVARDMPPHEESDRPSDADYEKMIGWLREELSKSEAIHAVNRPRDLRRLNGAEYSNVIRELFGLDLQSGADLPPDDALHGFDTVAEGQSLSAVHTDALVKSAAKIVDAAFPEEPWPGLTRNQLYKPATHRDAFGGSMQWGFYAPEGFMWTFRGLGPGGEGMVAQSGVYRVHFTVIPRQLQGGPGTYETPPTQIQLHDFTGPSKPHLVASVKGRDVAEFHIAPEQEGKEVPLEFEAFIPKGTEPGEIEIRYVNGTPGDMTLLRRGRHFSWEQRDTYPDELADMPPDQPFLLIVKKEFVGPLEDRWMTPQVREILDAGLSANDPASSIARILPKAFRRPVTPEEIEIYAEIARDEMKDGATYLTALKVALQSVLVSPDFLFIVEDAPDDSPRGSYALNPHELATRLSLFLWSSMPDERLAEAAAKGELGHPEGLRNEVDRMLRDPRAKSFGQRFAYQWLGLARLDSAMPERTLFPEFNWLNEMYDFYGTRLLKSMAREPIEFFNHVLTANAPVTDFIDSDYVVVDQSLARLYGIKGVIGGEFLKTAVTPESRRGGLLGMAGILTSTSEQTRTSPVIRGTWVLKRLFNRPPPPPPPGVGMIEPDTASARSLREKLELHRENSKCAGCHARIDPYGLTLENFDAIGRWRTHEPAWFDPARPEKAPLPGPDGKPVVFPIDSGAKLADGTELLGYLDLKDHLKKRRDEFTLGLAEKMFIYATGRGVLVSDTQDLQRIVGQTKADNYRIHTLIHAITTSRGFRFR